MPSSKRCIFNPGEIAEEKTQVSRAEIRRNQLFWRLQVLGLVAADAIEGLHVIHFYKSSEVMFVTNVPRIMVLLYASRSNLPSIFKSIPNAFIRSN